MEEEFQLLQKKFNDIKSLGWICSKRKGPTGIGKTFEELLGKEEESFNFPDFYGIEIKTKRYSTGQPFGLFSAEPDGEKMFEGERIRLNYGYPDRRFPQFLVFNCSVSAKKKTKLRTHYFTIEVDRIKEKIYLIVFNSKQEIIDKKTSWNFELLKEMLERKLKYLAIIKAYNKFENGSEYFKYHSMQTFKNVNFQKFINLIEQGKIFINFKIGVFTGEYRFGKPHNHGTGFNIYERDIKCLYENH